VEVHTLTKRPYEWFKERIRTWPEQTSITASRYWLIPLFNAQLQNLGITMRIPLLDWVGFFGRCGTMMETVVFSFSPAIFGPILLHRLEWGGMRVQ